jgi:hypothetical protein
MVLRSSTGSGRWSIIDRKEKFYARVKAVQRLVGLLTRELNYQPEDLLKSLQVSRQNTG